MAVGRAKRGRSGADPGGGGAEGAAAPPPFSNFLCLKIGFPIFVHGILLKKIFTATF